MLVAIESVTRPRWNAHRDATDRLVGWLVFVLALYRDVPLPLVNVIPGLVVALIAIAYLAGGRRAAAGGGRIPAIAWISSLAWTVWASAGAIIRLMA